MEIFENTEQFDLTKRMWQICDLTLGIDYNEKTQKTIINKNTKNNFPKEPEIFTNKAKNLHINAGLVGSNEDGVIVAFRGTDTDVKNGYMDWVQDFLAIPSQNLAFPGKVHLGFEIGLSTIFHPIENALIEQLKSNKTKKLYVVGHSKGAALATLASYLFSKNEQIMNILSNKEIEVITFASPRTGDKDFKSGYEKMPIKYTSYQSFLDIVPHLPGTKKELDLLEHINPIISLLKNTNKIPFIENEILNNIFALTKNIALDSLYSYEIIGTPIFFYEPIVEPKFKKFIRFTIPCLENNDSNECNNIYVQKNNKFLNSEYDYNLISLSNINQIIMSNIDITDIVGLFKNPKLIEDLKDGKITKEDFESNEILTKYVSLIKELFFTEIHYFSYKNMFS